MLKHLKNLKTQLASIWKNFENQILESNNFNILKEKYQSLNVRRQKLIKYLFFLFAFGSLTYLPLSYLMSSVLYWGEFKEKQQLSLEMLKVRNRSSALAFRHSHSQLKRKIEKIIKKYSTEALIQDQPAPFSSKIDEIQKINFNIQLSHLNIKQAIRLGTELNNLSQAHLNGITLEESKKYPKHYDTLYGLSAFIPKDKAPARALKKGKPKTTTRNKIQNLKKDSPKKEAEKNPGKKTIDKNQNKISTKKRRKNKNSEKQYESKSFFQIPQNRKK